jgi:hypothetical protein
MNLLFREPTLKPCATKAISATTELFNAITQADYAKFDACLAAAQAALASLQYERDKARRRSGENPLKLVARA